MVAGAVRHPVTELKSYFMQHEKKEQYELEAARVGLLFTGEFTVSWFGAWLIVDAKPSELCMLLILAWPVCDAWLEADLGALFMGEAWKGFPSGGPRQEKHSLDRDTCVPLATGDLAHIIALALQRAYGVLRTLSILANPARALLCLSRKRRCLLELFASRTSAKSFLGQLPCQHQLEHDRSTVRTQTPTTEQVTIRSNGSRPKLVTNKKPGWCNGEELPKSWPDVGLKRLGGKRRRRQLHVSV